DLEDRAAFFVAILPCEADIMLFGLHQKHHRSDAERHKTNPDGCTDTAMNVVAVAYFGNARCWNFEYFLALQDREFIRGDVYVDIIVLVEIEASAFVLHIDL